MAHRLLTAIDLMKGIPGTTNTGSGRTADDDVVTALRGYFRPAGRERRRNHNCRDYCPTAITPHL
jgi:hypothetical protein